MILYENEQILESTREVAAKYERILDIKKLIKRKERKALKDTTSLTNENRIQVQREALTGITSQTNTNRIQVQQDMMLQYNVERREGNGNITHHSSQHPSHTTAIYNNNNNQMQHVNIINENIAPVNQVESTQYKQDVHSGNEDEEDFYQEHCDNCQ